MYAKGSFLNGSFSSMYGTRKTYLILGVTRTERVEEHTLLAPIYRCHSFSRTQRPDLSLLILTPSLVNTSAGMVIDRQEGDTMGRRTERWAATQNRSVGQLAAQPLRRGKMRPAFVAAWWPKAASCSLRLGNFRAARIIPCAMLKNPRTSESADEARCHFAIARRPRKAYWLRGRWPPKCGWIAQLSAAATSEWP